MSQFDRSRFLGGSDVAAVLGVSDWTTPVELWMEKTGRRERDVDPAKERIYRRGHKLEPFIREMVIDKLADEGHDVELLATNKRYADPEFPFLACEIDFELALDGEHINSDAKSVSSYARKAWGAEGSDEIPLAYAAQFMHGLMVCPDRRQRCLVAALRSFDDVDIFWVERDDETIAAIREKMVSFWLDHVVADVPPDPVKFADVRALFPAPTADVIEATDEIAEKIEQLDEIKSRIKKYKKTEEALCLEVGTFIAPHKGVTYRGRTLATWNAHQATRIDIDRLKAERFDIYKQFSNSTTVRPLRLNRSTRG